MTPETDDVFAQLKRGDLEAAEALFEAYAPYLRAIVRRQLADRLRSKFDPSDVVQSVWVQVLAHLQRDGWEVGSEGELKALLATIARRRLVSRVRKEEARPTRPSPGAGGWDEVAATQVARPSEVAQAGDVWGRMLALCPPEHRQVLELRRQGLLLHDIAERTGMHEGSVRRVLRQLARRMALDQEPLDPATPAAGRA